MFQDVAYEMQVFFAHIGASSMIADFYLRTLLEIDREIVTQGALRTQEVCIEELL